MRNYAVLVASPAGDHDPFVFGPFKTAEEAEAYAAAYMADFEAWAAKNLDATDPDDVPEVTVQSLLEPKPFA